MAFIYTRLIYAEIEQSQEGSFNLEWCRCGNNNSNNNSKIQNPRIAGGSEVLNNKYPWFALIRKYYFILCSASLVTDYYIVTTASCFFSPLGRRLHDGGLEVGVGIHEMFGNENKLYIKVDKVIIHKSYKSGYHFSSLAYNIALLRLRRPVLNRTPVCLPVSDISLYPRTASVIGIGRERIAGEQRLNIVLKEVAVQIKSRCKHNLEKSVFCIKANEGKGVCRGDIGAPLITEINGGNFLVGITSNDDSCGHDESTFTNVPYFLSWIKDNVRGSKGCFS